MLVLPMIFGGGEGLFLMDVLVVDRCPTLAETAELCGRICAMLDRCDDDVFCDVRRVIQPDAAIVDVLARLELTAKRRGRRLWLLHADPALLELLAFAGLDDVVPCWEELGIETGRQSEQGEHPLRVEEETDPGDLSV